MAYKPKVLQVSEGGTSLATLTAHALYVGNGTSAPTALAVGAMGQTIIGQSGADPTWGSSASSSVSGVVNLGLKYTASTLSVTSASQTALSATNVGYVSIPSAATPGKVITYSIAADKSFIDDTGASNILGALFGLTTAVDWASAMPFYVYAVANTAETSATIAIARIPNLVVCPAAAHCGDLGAPSGADVSSSLFFLEDLTIADYVGGPVLCIGSFRMTKTSGAGNDWTVTALGSSDGIGQFNENTYFTMPSAQFGASANTPMRPNGGTAPVYTFSYTYNVMRNGRIGLYCSGVTNTTAGVGAVAAQLTIPFYINLNAGNVCVDISSNQRYMGPIDQTGNSGASPYVFGSYSGTNSAYSGQWDNAGMGATTTLRVEAVGVISNSFGL